MGKRYFTIFAGRSRYLQILCTYLDYLLQHSIIDEVHFWQFTSNKHDVQFMRAKCTAAPLHYKLFSTRKPDAHHWWHYYSHYAKALTDDDLIIKCDDDVVYLEKDVAPWRAFLDGVREEGLYFPNIVNNDVLAMIQQRLGVHSLFEGSTQLQERALHHDRGRSQPLTDWYMKYDRAKLIHQHFLEDPKRYHFRDEPVLAYGNRISINFFAARGSYAKQVYGLFSPRNYDDETIFAWMLRNRALPLHKINLNLTVVHFQFGPQNGAALDTEFLSRYAALAERTTTESICRS